MSERCPNCWPAEGGEEAYVPHDDAPDRAAWAARGHDPECPSHETGDPKTHYSASAGVPGFPHSAACGAAWSVGDSVTNDPRKVTCEECLSTAGVTPRGRRIQAARTADKFARDLVAAHVSFSVLYHDGWVFVPAPGTENVVEFDRAAYACGLKRVRP